MIYRKDIVSSREKSDIKGMVRIEAIHDTMTKQQTSRTKRFSCVDLLFIRCAFTMVEERVINLDLEEQDSTNRYAVQSD